MELPAQGFTPPGVALLATRRMWAITRGKGAIIAVIDTGVDYCHPDLAPNMLGGVSMVQGVKDYMDDNKEAFYIEAPFMNGKIASAGIKEICELLCTDSRAATDHNGKETGILEIWS